MTSFPRGLYESLVTEALAARLEALPADRGASTDALRTAEAADRIAWHISSVVERAIEMLPESQRTAVGVELARSLVDRVVEGTAVEELSDQRPSDPAGVLRGIHRLNPAGDPTPIDAPLIPLLDSALLTNSPGEPAVGHQVAAEIASADRTDLIMAFIRRSGIRPLREKLRKHVEAGGRLRVLTTTYTGSTETAALDWLAELGADVRVSYDTTSTRLHAKEPGSSTATPPSRLPTSGPPTSSTRRRQPAWRGRGHKLALVADADAEHVDEVGPAEQGRAVRNRAGHDCRRHVDVSAVIGSVQSPRDTICRDWGSAPSPA